MPEPIDSFRHPRKEHLVELLELAKMVELDMKSYFSRARSLHITVWTRILLHLTCARVLAAMTLLIDYYIYT